MAGRLEEAGAHSSSKRIAMSMPSLLRKGTNLLSVSSIWLLPCPSFLRTTSIEDVPFDKKEQQARSCKKTMKVSGSSSGNPTRETPSWKAPSAWRSRRAKRKEVSFVSIIVVRAAAKIYLPLPSSIDSWPPSPLLSTSARNSKWVWL